MYQATFEAQFMKKLSNNEAELKTSVAFVCMTMHMAMP